MKTLNTFFTLLVCFTLSANAQITSEATGNWSIGTTWVGGAVPGASDDVVIANGHTVTIDVTDAVCNNVAINGILTFPDVNGNSITVNGNVDISTSGFFNTYQTGNPTGIRNSYITIYGNLTITGSGRIDFRRGSGSNVGVGRLLFAGSSNSTITLTQTIYGSSIEEFNTVVINKTSGAKVILASGNLFQNNNSSTAADTLILTSGIVETQGTSVWVHLGTGGALIQGASSTSYVNGILGRGVSNSASSTNKDFPIGDADAYRPLRVHINAPVNATGHYLWAKVVSGDANTGSSTLNGGIIKVSEKRYYEIGYIQSGGSASSMPVDQFIPSYTTDDGVSEGNTDLRVAYSTDSRATWNAIAQSTPHETNLSSPPKTITPDVLESAYNINTGTSIFVSLASTSVVNPLPVELVSFNASLKNNSAQLNWSTATEVNNHGFEIERSAERSRSTTDAGVSTSLNAQWAKVGFVEGAGNSNSAKSYTFVDENLSAGRYNYRLKQIDNDGSFHYVGTIESIEIAAPKVFALSDNYPNPFNPSTTLEFTIPNEGIVSLKVFNLIGQEVATLFNEIAQAGKVNRVQFDARQLPSGIYFSKLQFGGQQIVKKMQLMK